MGEFRLRKGLSFCRIDHAVILLDAPADKYRMLGAALIEPFENFLAAEPLTDAQAALLERAGVIEKGDGAAFPTVPALAKASMQHAAMFEGRLRILPTLAAARAIRRVQRKIREHGLDAVLSGVRAPLARMDRSRRDDRSARRLLRAFEHSRYWMASADLCLPRSVALVEMLAERHFLAHVVLGVRIDPFRAHCWAQIDDVVLNDSAEEVGKFTPILVL